jgi:hypothetical protein
VFIHEFFFFSIECSQLNALGTFKVVLGRPERFLAEQEFSGIWVVLDRVSGPGNAGK